jgi:hypothetical protein
VESREVRDKEKAACRRTLASAKIESLVAQDRVRNRTTMG